MKLIITFAIQKLQIAMSESNRIIRKFERLVFKGVPEKPESSYERESHGYLDGRVTGKASIQNGFADLDDPDLITIATVTRYLDQEKTVVQTHF